MRGELKWLLALFLSDCPCAYYVHCFVHRLQLTLVVASQEVVFVHKFFSNLNFIINVVSASYKHYDELQAAQVAEITHLIAVDELETKKWANQTGTLKRAGDSRWASHFHSICSLIRIFGSTYSALENIIKGGSTYSQRGDANATYKMITSLKLIFILYLMMEIIGTTNHLCQHLQQKSQDILNAMQLVSSTKTFLQKLRNED
jgi:hypothetical protein